MKAGSMINERLDRRLRRTAWAAIAIALMLFALMAAGCGTQYHQICWVECPTGLPCHESCVLE